MNSGSASPSHLKATQTEFPDADRDALTEGTIARVHRLRDHAGGLLGGRIEWCGKRRLGSIVGLHRTAGGGAYYSGVETCGCLWGCPRCARAIAETRRAEIEQVMTAHKGTGGAAYMATLTMPHARFDLPGELRAGVTSSWQKVQAGNGWKGWKRAFGVVGTVRALEVTHGQNGWHPHLHILLLLDRPLSEEERGAAHWALFERWARTVERVTGSVCKFEASDFRPATAGDYVAKWGADSELAKAAVKVSRKGGRSPWQLLADAAAGDELAGALFRSYFLAFRGARQLTWSHGLKDLYGIGERPDAEAAAAAVEETDLPIGDAGQVGRIGDFDHATWRRIVSDRLTGRVLEAAATGGWPAVVALLAAHGLGSWFGPGDLPVPPSDRRPFKPRQFYRPQYHAAAWEEHIRGEGGWTG